MYNVPLYEPRVSGIPSFFRLSSSFSPSVTSLFDALVMAFMVMTPSVVKTMFANLFLLDYLQIRSASCQTNSTIFPTQHVSIHLLILIQHCTKTYIIHARLCNNSSCIILEFHKCISF